MSSSNPSQPHQDDHDADPADEDLLDAEDVGEEIENNDADEPMEDGDEEIDEDNIQEEIALQNDSTAHFDTHADSIFCISSHPVHENIIATGGGDDVAYLFDATTGDQTRPQDRPVLPQSYQTSPPAAPVERKGIPPLQKLDGHTDSVNAIAFTLPAGEYLVTAGLDGKLRAWSAANPQATSYTFLAEAAEVEEINWIAACPSPSRPNVVALGANDGSVWAYELANGELTQLMTQYLHTGASTAGAWTPDGRLLASVSEDSSLHVFDVFGTGSAVISLTAADARFEVDGGLYSVACTNTLVAVGGAGGHMRVIGLPAAPSTGTKSKSKKEGASSAGQILASLQAQSDGIEALSFSSPPLNLLAAGSVDGSIALFDTAHRFAVRRHIREAHEEYAVVKVQFLRGAQTGHFLVSGGMDGVVRVWDVRGGTAAANHGFVKEFRGHSSGEKGGLMGFVTGEKTGRVVTAGDDGVSLVFDLAL